MEEFPSYLVRGINSPRQAWGKEELQVRLEGRKWFGLSHAWLKWVLEEEARVGAFPTACGSMQHIPRSQTPRQRAAEPLGCCLGGGRRGWQGPALSHEGGWVWDNVFPVKLPHHLP